MITFGDKINSLIKMSNMKLRELAKRTEISKETLSRYIAGSSVPKIEDIDKIAEVFGLTANEIIGEGKVAINNPHYYQDALCAIYRNRTMLTKEQKEKIIKILLEEDKWKSY